MNITPHSQYGIANDQVTPEFMLMAFSGEDGNDPSDVFLEINFDAEPDHDTPAPHALMYGLAMMVLEQQGVVGKMIETLCADGIPSQAEAISQIELLFQGEANEYLA